MRAWLLALLLWVGAVASLQAEENIAAAQTIIGSQIEALMRDDAEAAYAFAAPAIRSVFPQADIFMAMVRANYAAIYRNKSFKFGEARELSGGVAQRVAIVDEQGVPWEALYTLEQQPDGSLKIIGCVLLKVGQAV